MELLRGLRLQACMLSVFLCAFFYSQYAFAEGSFQTGLNQPLREEGGGLSNRILVDIINPGEWINISLCGGNDSQNVDVGIDGPSGNVVPNNTPLTPASGKISCSDPMNAPIPNPFRFQATQAGQYSIRHKIQGGPQYLSRFDVTVTPDNLTDPDPTGATGITGRVSSLFWQFGPGGTDQASSTDANFYALVPGGFPSTNNVWQLDLNNFVDSVYFISANSTGVNNPKGSTTTYNAGNSYNSEFPVYLNHPAIAAPKATQIPTATGFSFTDSDGLDLKFSPGATGGVQDSGTFTFSTDASFGTYAVSIDANQDGVFGNIGDVFLFGKTTTGTNSVIWDGRDAAGNPLPIGNYNAELSVRIGEYHFVADRVPTSGGGFNAAVALDGRGLAIFESSAPGTLVPTRMYWDDQTETGGDLTGDEIIPSTLPDGILSGTLFGVHTWGSFQSTGFAADKFVDTYVFSAENTTTTNLIVASDDTPYSPPVTGVATVDATVVGGIISASVEDLNLAGSGNTTVVLNNTRTGELETVTLTESGTQPGLFENTISIVRGLTADGSDTNGSMNVVAGDTIEITYNDAEPAPGDGAVITANDQVDGTDGVPAIIASDPTAQAQLQVNDIDITGVGTITVQVTNVNTGEVEPVALSETAPGEFTGTLQLFSNSGQNPNPGQMNAQALDVIRIDYDDDFRADGTTQTTSATDTIAEGTAAAVTLDATAIGQPVLVTVIDADLAGTGTLSVLFGNTGSAGPEPVSLTEVVGDPGRFEGSFPTVFGPAGADVPGDGIFNATGGDTFQVEVDDPLRTAGAPSPVIAMDTIAGGFDGSLTVSGAAVGMNLDIQVTDNDLIGAGSISVSVVNLTTTEIETATLTEVGGNPGTFQGSVVLQFGMAADGSGTNGSINVSTGNLLDVTYSDALRGDGSSGDFVESVTVSGGNSGVPTITATKVPENLIINVVDSDLLGTGTLVVAVSNQTTTETETVTLIETGPATGVFIAQVATAFGIASDGDGANGSMNAAAGDILVLSYLDALKDNGSSGNTTAFAIIQGGVTGTGSITATAVAANVSLQITDSDLAGNGTLQVSVSNGTTGGIETVTLTETGAATGSFTGTIATAFGTVPDGNQTDGSINVSASDVLTLTYNDASDASGAPVDQTFLASVGGGSDAVPTISIDKVGDPVLLGLSDGDLIGDGTASGELTNQTTGEVETVSLTETSPGTFTISLPTVGAAGSDGAGNNGSINVLAGDVLSFSFFDALKTDGSTGPVTAQDAPTGGFTALPSINPQGVGSSVQLSLQDADLAGSGTASVMVSNLTNGETETVTLNETSAGVFTGTLPSTFGSAAGPNDDGTIFAAAGDTVELRFDDPFLANGSTGTVLASSGMAGGTNAVVALTATTVGQPLNLSVEDTDLVGTGSTSVTVTNVQTGEIENVTLTELGANTGQFSGTLSTLFGSASDGSATNSSINASSGDTLTLVFQDVLQTDGSTASVTASAAISGGGSAGTIAMTATAVWEPLAISVVDADLAGNGTVDVTVTNPATSEAETVTLQESATPGAFEGVLPTTYGTNNDGSPTNGSIAVAANQALTASYTDTTVSSGTPITLTANATPLGGNNSFVRITTTLVGQVITLEVTDPDLAGQGTATATVQTSAVGDTETVALTETGASTGIFRGTIQSAFGTSPDGSPTNGSINTTSADIVSISYRDELLTSGAKGTARATVVINGGPDVSAPQLVEDTFIVPFQTATILRVLDNDQSSGTTLLSLTGITQPSSGSAAMNADGTIQFTPANGFTGTTSLTYTACTAASLCETATVNITVTPQPATVTGKVFQDRDHDQQHDPNEELLSGWQVELVRNGSMVANAATDMNGSYQLSAPTPANDYSIVFKHPDTGMVWSRIDNASLTAGVAILDQNLPIDPSGVVYDAATREPLAGITVFFTGASGTPLPDACFVIGEQQGQTTGTDGRYRFDLVPNGATVCPASETEYRIALNGLGGAPIDPSTAIPPVTAPLDPTGLAPPVTVVASANAPLAGGDTTYHLSFILQSGDPDVVNNHIPVAASTQSLLFATKTSSRRTVSRGDLVSYTISFQNTATAPLTDISVTDTLPANFVYRAGTGSVNGTRAEPVINGKQLVWSGLTVQSGQTLTVQLATIAGSRLPLGEHTNTAYAESAISSSRISNIARATVTSEGDPDFDCATIIGRVFEDQNDNGSFDSGEPGLKGIRLATVKGTLIRTGKHGRYHLPCAAVPNSRIGSNFVLKLDERTVPNGYSLTGDNPKIVRLTRGKMTALNFAVKRMAEIALDFSSEAFASDSIKLRPKYGDGIRQLIEALEANPGSLALNYHGDQSEREIGRKRLRSIQLAVEQAWAERGTPYKLSIERTLQMKR